MATNNFRAFFGLIFHRTSLRSASAKNRFALGVPSLQVRVAPNFRMARNFRRDAFASKEQTKTNEDKNLPLFPPVADFVLFCLTLIPPSSFFSLSLFPLCFPAFHSPLVFRCSCLPVSFSFSLSRLLSSCLFAPNEAFGNWSLFAPNDRYVAGVPCVLKLPF